MDQHYLLALFAAALLAGCSPTSDLEVQFGPPGSLGTEDGAGTFRFGASTAAAQIEDENSATDWYAWTLPVADGGAGEGHFIEDAVRGKTKVLDDMQLLSDMDLDSYRFSMAGAAPGGDRGRHRDGAR